MSSETTMTPSTTRTPIRYSNRCAPRFARNCAHARSRAGAGIAPWRCAAPNRCHRCCRRPRIRPRIRGARPAQHGSLQAAEGCCPARFAPERRSTTRRWRAGYRTLRFTWLEPVAAKNADYPIGARQRHRLCWDAGQPIERLERFTLQAQEKRWRSEGDDAQQAFENMGFRTHRGNCVPEGSGRRIGVMQLCNRSKTICKEQLLHCPVEVQP